MCHKAWRLLAIDLLLFLIACGVVSRAKVCASDEDAVRDVMDAGIEKWRNGLDFCCHYSYRCGMALTKEQGLEGHFDTASDPEFEMSARGIMCKRGDDIRFSCTFSKAPEANKTASGEAVSLLPCDAVKRNDLWLVYWPRAGRFGNTANIDKMPSSGFKANEFNIIETSFSFGGGSEAPLKSFITKFSKNGAVETSVVEPDRHHTTVIMTLKQTDGGSLTERVTFWTEASPPVIESRESIVDGGGHHGERFAVASKFVQCGKGMMARELHLVSGPITLSSASTSRWLAYEWKSDDLGQRAAESEDFVVTIPPDVHISGLRKPPPEGTERRLDLAKYTVADLGESTVSGGKGGHPTDATTAPRVAIAVLCAVLIVILALILVWRRKTATK
jgi:hypothetical protein